MIKNTHVDFERLLRGGEVASSAVLIAFLDEIDLPYENIRGGLKLRDRPDPLDETSLGEHIRRNVEAEWLADLDLQIYRTVGSTNDEVMQSFKGEGAHHRMYLAERQSAGKGRRGRRWVSPYGKNIYLSVGAFIELPLAQLGGLSLIIGMQVVEVLRSYGMQGVGLKWPNDVLYGSGKLAGILIEISPRDSRGSGIIAGVGINLSLSEADAVNIDQPWSDASVYLGIARNDLAASLAAQTLKCILEFADSGFSGFKEKWQRYNVNADAEVMIMQGDERIIGMDRGVDDNGNLLLETNAGLEVFNSGEVSLRPVKK